MCGGRELTADRGTAPYGGVTRIGLVLSQVN